MKLDNLHHMMFRSPGRPQERLERACADGDLASVAQAISEGAKIAGEKFDVRPPLAIACANGHARVAEYLLQQGANANQTNKIGRAVIHFAAVNKRIECIELLTKFGAKKNPSDIFGYDTVLIACETGQSEVLDFVFSEPNAESVDKTKTRTYLHTAAKFGHAEVVAKLLGLGIPANELDSRLKSAAHYACEGGHHQALSVLLDHGAKIDAPDSQGMLPIHHACKKGSLECFEALMLSSETLASQVNVGDQDGNTAAHYAAQHDTPDRDLIAALIYKGFDFEAVNRFGENPGQFAERHGAHHRQEFIQIAARDCGFKIEVEEPERQRR